MCMGSPRAARATCDAPASGRPKPRSTQPESRPSARHSARRCRKSPRPGPRSTPSTTGLPQPFDDAAVLEPGFESARQRADVRNAFGMQLLRDQSCGRVVGTIAVDDDLLVDAELQLLDVRNPDAAWNPARAFATVCSACIQDRDLHLRAQQLDQL